MQIQLKQIRLAAVTAALAGVSLFCHVVQAQERNAKETPQAPPLASEIADQDEAADLVKPAANLLSTEQRKMVKKSGREIRYFLPIQLTEGFIYNPSTKEYDKVALRSYGRNLSGVPNMLRPDFVAPTVVMKPGQTVRFDLSNRLEKEPDCEKVAENNVNTPHCFNTTNLHSHGLWISPAGNSDNVLLAIKPKVNFEYEYNVPVDHPAGTFWYHPHVHGSTAIQVGSGMAGALIVKGDRQPTIFSNGDLDTLLNPFKPAAGNYGEVMLMQQIPYACFVKDASGKEVIQTNPDGTWLCKPGEIGEVKDFKAQFGPNKWGQSGRHTLINGFARNPARPLVMEAGKLYRWRLVDAGVREPIALRIRKINDISKLRASVSTTEERDAEVKAACTGADVLQFEVAADGLTRPNAFAKIINVLQPGYRSDILFSLPEKGDYCVYSEAGVTEFDNQPPTPESPLPQNAKVLTVIHAVGNKTSGDQTQFVTKELVRAAGLLSRSVRDTIIKDLKDGLKLTKFVPHKSIPESEVTNPQNPVDLTLGIDLRSTPIFEVNGAPYDPSKVNQTLILGNVQEWHIKSYNPTATGEAPVQHPFHIHVNPFQIISITDKDGKDVSALTNTETPGIGQYAGLQGVWKDTIMATPGYTIKTRTRYQRYIGEYVLHCHILDHEDQGMMQNVKVVLPDGNGGAATGAHGAHGSH